MYLTTQHLISQTMKSSEEAWMQFVKCRQAKRSPLNTTNPCERFLEGKGKEKERSARLENRKNWKKSEERTAKVISRGITGKRRHLTDVHVCHMVRGGTAVRNSGTRGSFFSKKGHKKTRERTRPKERCERVASVFFVECLKLFGLLDFAPSHWVRIYLRKNYFVEAAVYSIRNLCHMVNFRKLQTNITLLLVNLFTKVAQWKKRSICFSTDLQYTAKFIELLLPDLCT